jgi:DNA-binding IclR family transcriptional regulator
MRKAARPATGHAGGTGRSARGRSQLPAPARRGIQSVTTGFRVLAALAEEPGPAALSAVAQRAGLSPSQAHRYLASLIEAGMARQDSSSGRYELGAHAIQIGLAALTRTDVFAEADPAVAAFARDTGRTTLIVARGPLGPTIVRWHTGRMPVITSLAIGSVLPLLRSATGHAFLAFMADEERAGALMSESNPKAALAQATAICAEVRKTMSASVDEMLIPGLRATAVPILDIQGRAALVATMIATEAFPRRDDREIVAKLQSVCRTLTERLGARWKDTSHASGRGSSLG